MTKIDIKMPKKFTIETIANEPGNYCTKYTILDLPMGYGNTLGNALRRVLLSSIKGYAIKKVIIPGVSSEYSCIRGVKQNLVSILLALKDIAIDSNLKSEFSLKLNFKGPSKIYAKDVISDKLTVKNPDLFLFEIVENINFEMEIFIDYGIGFKDQLSFIQDGKEKDLNEIYLDCSYSPVKDVMLKVSNGRFDENDIQLEEFVLEVKTNGTVSANDLISEAANNLVNFFNIFTANISHSDSKKLKASVKDEESASYEDDYLKLFLPVNAVLILTVRSANGLEAAGIKYIGDLVSRTEDDIRSMKNLGKCSVDNIKEQLHQKGLDFGMKNKWSLVSKSEIEKIAKIAKSKFNV